MEATPPHPCVCAWPLCVVAGVLQDAPSTPLHGGPTSSVHDHGAAIPAPRLRADSSAQSGGNIHGDLSNPQRLKLYLFAGLSTALLPFVHVRTA